MMRRVRSLLLWLWKVLPIPRWGQYAILWLANAKYLVGVVGVVFDEQEQVDIGVGMELCAPVPADSDEVGRVFEAARMMPPGSKDNPVHDL